MSLGGQDLTPLGGFATENRAAAERGPSGYLVVVAGHVALTSSRRQLEALRCAPRPRHVLELQAERLRRHLRHPRLERWRFH